MAPKFLIWLSSIMAFSACGPLLVTKPQAPSATPTPDSLVVGAESDDDVQAGLRAARWHLLRASEERNLREFERARRDLDEAFHILADLDTDESPAEADRKQTELLSMAVESTYFEILPHLDQLSADSPLVLLLEGLSEEKIEDLSPDAAPIARIHQLRQYCDVPIDANPKVAASIHFFMTRGREAFTAWMKRSGRYRRLILDILAEENLPRDFLYLAMIESGFNPRAYSRARAVGLWQFMAATGRLEGLKQSHWIDERRDPVKSTRAAARHLQRLYLHFGDWRLAAAAYNSGLGRVSRAIEHAGTRDFWELELPSETANYVPLFMAAVIINKDPQAFGFDLKMDDPVTYSEVKLTTPVRLKAAAKCSRCSLAELKELNPELRRAITPLRRGASYRLRVPVGAGRRFSACYDKLPHSERFAWNKYVIQGNDNISSIAASFGVTTRLIAEANDLRNPDRIFVGQVLHIPMAGGLIKTPGTSEPYSVRTGDSLSRIAQRHGVALKDLRSWNNLSGDVIHPGQRLRVATTLLSSRKHPTLLGSMGRPLHVVTRGETLWSISHRFAVEIADLRAWNRLKGSLIHPGQQLIIGESEAETYYTVARGDTLYSIARRFGLTAEDLADQNKISLSTILPTGMTLRIEPLN